MTYQMLITLDEQEYATLKDEANKSGVQPETLFHEYIRQLSSTKRTKEPMNRPLTSQEFLEKQFREGKILNIATHRQMTPEEEAELERLGRLFADENKLISDEVIEDRGPY